MDLTDIPDDVRGTGEDAPDFGEWESPEEVLKEGSTRERLLDVVVQLRDPETVSTIAQQANCDTETARDYLEWFAEMGMVREHPGRPVRYERNESYFRWRRIERIRQEYSEEEIVTALAETVTAIEEFREQFDVKTPDAVSLRDLDRETGVEETWEALSEWQTLERRADLLDAACRDGGGSRGVGHVDV